MLFDLMLVFFLFCVQCMRLYFMVIRFRKGVVFCFLCVCVCFSHHSPMCGFSFYSASQPHLLPPPTSHHITSHHITSLLRRIVTNWPLIWGTILASDYRIYLSVLRPECLRITTFWPLIWGAILASDYRN